MQRLYFLLQYLSGSTEHQPVWYLDTEKLDSILIYANFQFDQFIQDIHLLRNQISAPAK